MSLKAVRISNVRSIKDSGYQNIAPLTILLGANGTGKSSFIRSLLLLKQSLLSKLTNPISFYGDYVDFGDFDACLSRYGDSKEITFGFEVSEPNDYFFYRPRKMKVTNSNKSVKLEITIAKAEDDTYVKGIALYFDIFIVKFQCDANGKINNTLIYEDKKKVFEDQEGRLEIQKGTIFPSIRTREKNDNNDKSFFQLPFQLENDAFFFSYNKFSFSLYENAKKKNIELKKVKTSFDDVLKAREKIAFTSLSDLNQFSKEFGKLVFKDSKDYDVIKLLSNYRNQFIKMKANILLEILYRDIFSTIRSIHYLGPLRATAERYYRNRPLDTYELDTHGRNLPNIINSMPKDKLNNFNKWVKELLGVELSAKIESGHLSLFIKEGDSCEAINLSDTGFGYSQLLPIITQIWQIINNRRRESPFEDEHILIVEQPELHLHPKLQAKLAELFSSAIKKAIECKVQFKIIIETHSQYLINALGRRIQNIKDIQSKDINILMFEKDKSTNISNIKFDSDGYLENWPYGFFETE